MADTQLSPPSVSPANRDSMPGMMRLVLSKFLQHTDDMLPAEVVSYDRATNLAEVYPLIVIITTLQTQIKRASVSAVPVLQLGGGGFVASFPLNKGDLGWIKANDRDISLFKQFYAQSAPNTYRKHSFEDAMFIPDTMLRGVSVAGEDTTNLVIQNLTGTVKVSWWANLLKIIAPRVGIGGTPDANLQLDVQSTTKAFAMPRMTAAQRDAIPSPQDGFLVWVTDTHYISSYNGDTNSWS